MVLDHVIATVPDLRATHGRLLDAGFQEAWPPGPFWPSATTSGIARGGANLELVQPDAGVAVARIDTLVLAPASLDEGRAAFPLLAFVEREKVEPDPALLALRGFPPDSGPQTICTNLLPEAPPYPFFLCLYVPFLRERLAPSRFPCPRGPVASLLLRSPDPEATRRLFAGHLGPIGIEVDLGPEGVAEIRFSDGSLLTANDL